MGVRPDCTGSDFSAAEQKKTTHSWITASVSASGNGGGGEARGTGRAEHLGERAHANVRSCRRAQERRGSHRKPS